MRHFATFAVAKLSFMNQLNYFPVFLCLKKEINFLLFQYVFVKLWKNKDLCRLFSCKYFSRDSLLVKSF